MDTNKWHGMRVDTETPAPRDYHSSCIYMDKLVIFGGAVEKSKTNDLYEYMLQPYEPPSSLKSDYVNLSDVKYRKICKRC